MATYQISYTEFKNIAKGAIILQGAKSEDKQLLKPGEQGLALGQSNAPFFQFANSNDKSILQFPSQLVFRTIDSNIVFSLSNNEVSIPKLSLNTALEGTSVITANALSASSVTTEKIAASNITTSKLAPDVFATISNVQIGSNNILSNSITSSKLVAASVTTEKLASDVFVTMSNVQIGSNNILSNSITSSKLANGSVTSEKLDSNISVVGDLSVAGNLVVNGSTTTVNTETVLIEDNILTLNANQTGTPASFLQSGIEVKRGALSNYLFVFDEATDLFKVGVSNQLQAVATRDDALATGYPYYDSSQAKLINKSLASSDLADNIITTSKITDSNITAAKHAANSVLTSHIADSNVTSAKIGANTIVNANIADSAITNSKITDDTILATKIHSTVLNELMRKTSVLNFGTSDALAFSSLTIKTPLTIQRAGQIAHMTFNENAITMDRTTTFNSNINVLGQILVNGAQPTYSQWITSGSNLFYSTSSNNSNVGIGTSNPQYKLHVAGDIFATSTVTFSDQRFKTDIVPISNGLEKVLALRGYTYKFIEGNENSDVDRKHAGVMAQEVEAVLPEVINKAADGRLSVAYGNMAALFIEAIRDLKAEIDQLKIVVANLKAE